MTRRKRAPALVEGAINNISTMRQHADKAEREIEILALRRVLEQLTGELVDDTAPLPRLSLVNVYSVDEGQPLLGCSLFADDEAERSLPSLVLWQEEAIPGVTDDVSSLPGRFYDVSLHYENGRVRGLYLDLDWSPA